jgi:hypothetical protein
MLTPSGRPLMKQVRTALIGLAAAAAIASGALVSLDLRRWSLALIGLGMAALLWQIGSRANLIRFRAVATLVGAVGISISVAN